MVLWLLSKLHHSGMAIFHDPHVIVPLRPAAPYIILTLLCSIGGQNRVINCALHVALPCPLGMEREVSSGSGSGRNLRAKSSLKDGQGRATGLENMLAQQQCYTQTQQTWLWVADVTSLQEVHANEDCMVPIGSPKLYKRPPTSST